MIGIGIGVATFVVLWLSCWAQCVPPVGSSVQFRVVLPEARIGSNEPLIATGRFEAADFLTLNYTGPNTAVVKYDSWGPGGPSSAPLTVHAGDTRMVEVVMPSFTAVRGESSTTKRLLVVFLDRREIFRAEVNFHSRQPRQLYFGVNPIGGDPARAFRGKMYTLDGRPLRGGAAALFSYRERLSVLWHDHRTYFAAMLAAALAIGFATTRCLSARPVLNRLERPLKGGVRPPHGTFLLVAGICTLAFAALITGGTFQLVYPETFGGFYDAQAHSLLAGHLDVPRAALCTEEFIVGGKFYGYFGLTPALFRIPFAAVHVRTDQLSRCYMLGYYLLSLFAAYALLCHATRCLCGRGSWPSRWAVVLLISGTGIGSTLFFLGSHSYTYHEAILSGAMLALWAAYFSLRFADEPTSRWWMPSLACGILALHARPPAGLFALALLMTVVVWPLVFASRESRAFRVRNVAILAAIAVGVFSLNAVSYLKFRTFDAAPLQYNVRYDEARLAAFDGQKFQLANFRHNFDTYVALPGVHLERRFPYLIFDSKPQREYPEAKMDLTEGCAAFPYAMPGLFGLAVGGGLWALASAPRCRRSIVCLVIGVIPMAWSLVTAIATSHRYTADFCPFFIATAAFGLAVIDLESPPLRVWLLMLASALIAASAVVTPVLALQEQGELLWGVQPEIRQNYAKLCERMDGILGTAAHHGDRTNAGNR